MNRIIWSVLLLAILVSRCTDKIGSPVPRPDNRAVVRMEDYQYLRFKYFFLDHAYREQYRHYASKWVHIVDPARAIARVEVYRTTSESDPEAIMGVAYRHPPGGILPGDSTQYHSGFFTRFREVLDYDCERNLGYLHLSAPLSESEVLAVAWQDSRGHVVGDVNYALDPVGSRQRPIRLKLLKSRVSLPSHDLDDTSFLEWKNVYNLGHKNISWEGFQAKVFFKPLAGDPQEILNDPGRLPLSYLHILGLDERDASGGSTPDGLIDHDPAMLSLEEGEMIFPDLRPFAPAGVFVDQIEQPILLPPEKYATAIYDTSSVIEISRASKFFIEVKLGDSQ